LDKARIRIAAKNTGWVTAKDIITMRAVSRRQEPTVMNHSLNKPRFSPTRIIDNFYTPLNCSARVSGASIEAHLRESMLDDHTAKRK
jgi:hypothetical protein